TRVQTSAPPISVSTDRIRINVTNALSSYSRIVEIEAWTASSGQSNVALAANGGVAYASSTYSSSFPVTAVNNGDRSGAAWQNGGGWNDGTYDGFPDWIQVNFNGSKTIDHVVVYTLRDAYGLSVEPTDSETFTYYGIVDFTVQGWNGASWLTLATVTGNNLVKRTVTFSPVSTDRIRINVTSALSSYSRIVEIEAWTASSGQSNVALAANGGVASASSTYSSSFPVTAVNNGDRSGAAWQNGRSEERRVGAGF